MDIFIDESGNVELGVRDRSQLFFTIGSHNATRIICSDIAAKVYKNKKPKELKFQNIKRKCQSIVKAKRILKALIDNNIQIRTYTIYKPFYIFNSFITLCQDPVLEKLGIETGDENFIKTRRNLIWFYTLFTVGPEFLAELIDKYQMLILNKDKATLEKVIKFIGNNTNDPLSIYAEINGYLNNQSDAIVDLITQPHINNDKLLWLDETSWIDVTLSSTRYLLKSWGNNYKFNIDIYHDESIPLEKRAGFFELMSELDDISINSFKFVNSNNCISVQIADIIAGTFNFWYEKTLMKCLNKVTPDMEKRLDTVNEIINIVPADWHIHLLPDIECLTDQQKNILESCRTNGQHINPFCFEVFSQ